MRIRNLIIAAALIVTGCAAQTFPQITTQQVTFNGAHLPSQPTISGLATGIVFTVIFVQNGTTACTWTWPATVHGGGTVTTTLSGVSTQQFVVSKNGTDAYAVSTMQNVTGGTP